MVKIMKSMLNELMHKEMSRKEFMTVLVFGVASIFGFSALLRLLGHKSPLQSSTFGYGASVYGGRKG